MLKLLAVDYKGCSLNTENKVDTGSGNLLPTWRGVAGSKFRYLYVKEV